jgi:hypothetical protein
MPLLASSWRERRADFLKARMVTAEGIHGRKDQFEACRLHCLWGLEVWGSDRCLGA